MAQKGTVTVEKTGEVFSGVNVSGSEDSDVIYQPVYEVAGLEGAVYEVRAAEDISTPDGTLRYSKGEVVDTITTSSDGFVKSKELYLGKYEVKEITAPDGMVISGETHTVELTYAGQNISVTETSTSFYNERQKVQVSLAKAIEKDKTFGIGDNGEIKNISFGLYAAEDIVSASGTVIPADGLIEIVSVNENGTAVMKSDLPFGKYYVKEIATDEHYVLNGKKYLVNFEYMGQEVTTVSIDCGQFVNELKRGKIEGIKVNESNEPLENALFGLFAVDTAEFTSENAYMTAVSDENGYFEFDEIPYGEYVVHEIEAPTGYILSDESYPVTVCEDGETITVRTINKPITVELSKIDVYGEELIGAEMQLENANGEIVDEWTSDGTNHVVTELPAGDYTLKEIAAPDGYVIATDIKFTVDVYGNVTVENVEATATSENGNPLVVMIDDTTKVQISKQDITTGEELPGAKLQVIDRDGNVVEEWVSSSEPHFIEGKLIAGKEYTLKETIAPEGYEIANEIKFTVNADGSVTEVIMYDELTPKTTTPYTGDNHSDFAAFAMLGAASVIIAILIITKKGKKQ